MLNPRCFSVRGALLHFMLSTLSELKVEVTNVMQPVALAAPDGPVPLIAAPYAAGRVAPPAQQAAVTGWRM